MPRTGSPRRILIAAVALAGLAAHPARAVDFEPARRDTALERRIARIAAHGPGRMSVAALNLDTGAHARVSADVLQPMWSVLKLPLAAHIVDRVSQGRDRWADSLDVPASLMNPNASPIAAGHPQGGRFALGTLVDTMLVTSDNSAADALFAHVGGPAAVTAWLRAQRLRGIRLDRSVRQLGDDAVGVPANLPPPRDARDVRVRREACTPARRTAAMRRFVADPRDRATAEGLVLLLARLARGEGVGAAGWQRLEAPLLRCTTGDRRLRAGLPSAVRVAERSGTGAPWRGVHSGVNDVGILRLPGSGGRVAIAVLIADAPGPLKRSEAAIADVARAVFEAWNAPD